jgi:hypothetical protein
MSHHTDPDPGRGLGCDCLSCEIVWASLAGPAVDQLVAEIGDQHRLRARAETHNLTRRAYVEGRWPHRHTC